MKAHQVAGLVDAVKAGQNGAVDALFDAVAELVGELATEVKGGRGLTSRNLALIKRVVDSLSAFVAGDPASTTDPDPQVADAEAKALHANFTESFNALIALTKRG